MRRVLIGLICLLFLSGTAGAVTYADLQVDLYDGYQLNNYVVEVTEVVYISSQDFYGANFSVYDEQGKLVAAKFLTPDQSHIYNLDDGQVIATLKDVLDANSTKVTLETTYTPWKNVYLYGSSDKPAHENAQFVYPPNLQISMTADKKEMRVNEQVMVTVSVANIGEGTAKDVHITGYTLNPQLSYVSGNTEWSGTIEAGSDPIYIMYTVRAVEEGTAVIPRATAAYEDYAGRSYMSQSPQLKITVEKPVATLNATVSFDKDRVSVGDRVKMSARIENPGDIAADNVRVDFNLPEGLTLKSGDNELYENVIKPKEFKRYQIDLVAVELGEYSAGIDVFFEDGETHARTDKLIVEKTKFDKTMEKIKSIPIYYYLVPILVFGGFGGWVLWRHQQYKF